MRERIGKVVYTGGRSGHAPRIEEPTPLSPGTFISAPENPIWEKYHGKACYIEIRASQDSTGEKFPALLIWDNNEGYKFKSLEEEGL